MLAVLLVPSGAYAQLSDEDIARLQATGVAEGWTFTVGRNPATEVPLEDLCGLVVPDGWEKGARFDPCIPERDLPSTFDWRTLGGVTPIRNQGGCGSCWAFATVGALECNIKIRDGVTTDLSEQYLVNCNRSGWSCSGGWWAHDYHESIADRCGGIGAVSEADCPYTAHNGSCSCPYPHPYRIAYWSYIGGSSGVPSTESIKQAIIDHGPVSVAVSANSAMQAYNGGIFNGCEYGTINHAVVLVGWDDNQGGGVWFMRNSWGPGWGEGGYMRMPYFCSQIGYAACYVHYPYRGLSVTPAGGLVAAGPRGGPFTPGSVGYTVENLGDYDIDYFVTNTAPWISLTNTSGSLAAHATIDVTASINAGAGSLPDGIYADKIRFINTTDHIHDTTLDVSLTVGTPQLAYGWSLDTNPGWSADGLWAWGQPMGAGGERGTPDPASGHTGSNVCGYNLGGDYENNLPERHLTSTAINCSELSQVRLKFWRWLGVDQPTHDHAYVRVSNNGTDWVTIWQNSGEVADPSWTLQDFDISSVADGHSTVYLRWTMGTTNSGLAYCGWNIDDIEVGGLSIARPLGACCRSGNCSVTNQAGCNGTWMGAWSVCNPIPCPGPSGACCQGDGSCIVETQAGCTGTWLGAGVSCAPGRCPAPTGACCQSNGSCTIKTLDDCVGTWLGDGTACNPGQCPPASGCLGDSNCDGAVNWRDIDFFVASMSDNVTAWEAMFAPGAPACPFWNSDANVDGVVDWRDIDSFVGRMNAGCP